MPCGTTRETMRFDDGTELEVGAPPTAGQVLGLTGGKIAGVAAGGGAAGAFFAAGRRVPGAYPYNVVAGDDGWLVEANASGGPVIVRLPNATGGVVGIGYRVAAKKVDATGNAVTVMPWPGEFIESPLIAGTSFTTQAQVIWFECVSVTPGPGPHWRMVAEYGAVLAHLAAADPHGDRAYTDSLVAGTETGYTAPTGTRDKTTAWDPSTVTLTQLAEFVAALYDTLAAKKFPVP